MPVVVAVADGKHLRTPCMLISAVEEKERNVGMTVTMMILTTTTTTIVTTIGPGIFVWGPAAHRRAEGAQRTSTWTWRANPPRVTDEAVTPMSGAPEVIAITGETETIIRSSGTTTGVTTVTGETATILRSSGTTEVTTIRGETEIILRSVARDLHQRPGLRRGRPLHHQQAGDSSRRSGRMRHRSLAARVACGSWMPASMGSPLRRSCAPPNA